MSDDQKSINYLYNRVSEMEARIDHLERLNRADAYLERGYLGAIIAAAAAATGHTRAAITSASRSAEMVKIRGAIILIAIDKGRNVTEIGRALNRDHTTILHHLHDLRQKRPQAVLGLMTKILNHMTTEGEI